MEFVRGTIIGGYHRHYSLHAPTGTRIAEFSADNLTEAKKIAKKIRREWMKDLKDRTNFPRDWTAKEREAWFQDHLRFLGYGDGKKAFDWELREYE